MTEVPVTQLGAMRDAKQCRGAGQRGRSRTMSRLVGQSGQAVPGRCWNTLTTGPASQAWTVCWVAETETAVLETVRGCAGVD